MFTRSAAGNYALSRALTWAVPENRAGCPTATLPVRWAPVHSPAVQGSC